MNFLATEQLDQRLIERKENRVLLFFYDILTFLMVFYVLFVIRPSDFEKLAGTKADLVPLFFLPVVCSEHIRDGHGWWSGVPDQLRNRRHGGFAARSARGGGRPGSGFKSHEHQACGCNER